MDDKEIRILRAILLDWEYRIGICPDEFVRTKFDRILFDMRDMIEWLDRKTGDKRMVIESE